MTALFAANYANQNARTQAEMKTVFETLRSVLAETMGGSSQAIATVVSNTFTPANNSCIYQLDIAASGNLNTITPTNIRDGQQLLLRNTNAARVITVKNAFGGTGQVFTQDAADFALTDPKQWILIQYNASLSSGSFEEVARSYAGQKSAFRTYLGLGTAATATIGNSAGNVPDASTVFDNVATQTQNRFVGSPNGFNGVLSVRALVAADLPTVTLAKGGTGFTAAAGALKSLLVGAGGSVYKELTGGSALQQLRVNSGGTDLEWFTAGSTTVFQSTDQTITAAGALTLAHSLGTTPKNIWTALVCQTAELGYSTGDVVYMGFPNPQGCGISIIPDATNLNVRYFSGGTLTFLVNKSTGVNGSITNGNWKMRFFAI